MENTPPKDVWCIIFSHLIDRQKPGIERFNEIKKLKLVSKFFYDLCDSDAMHKLISQDFVTSAIVLNTKAKKDEFYTIIFKTDEERLQWIFESAVFYDAPSLVTKLIDRGIDPNLHYGRENGSKAPALYRAAALNALNVARALLDCPAVDPNRTGESSDTPLIVAAKRKHTQMIELLLQHPLIDSHAINLSGETALRITLNTHNERGANLIMLQQSREEEAKRKNRCCCECIIF